MRSIKFKWLIILFCPLVAAAEFSDQECIQASFSAKVAHKSFIFGLFENELDISKKECLVKIEHKKWRYIKSNWEIDVCRGPVHIKEIGQSVDVFKRTNPCEGMNDNFCKLYRKIKIIVQDDGLIFAPGSKDDLGTEHGRIFCVYKIMNRYLNNGIVMSESGQDENEFSPGGSLDKPQGKVEVDSTSGPGKF